MKDRIIEYSLVESISHLNYTKFDVALNMVSKDSYLNGKEILRYYDDKFSVYNARYVNLGGSRDFAKANLHKASLVVQFLNPSLTEDDLRRWIRGKIKRYSGDSAIKALEASRLSKEWFGEELITEELQSETSIQWISKYPLTNPHSESEENEKYFEHVVKERQKFSLACHNKIKSSDSIQEFIAAYESAKNLYGTVSATDVSELTKMNINSVRRVYGKIQSVEMDEPKPIFGNKKFIETERKIVSTGEDIHSIDRQIITKQRIHKKGRIGRPTINSHWDNVNEYFNELNKVLEDGSE